MLPEERKKLENRTSEYLGIGISQGGVPRGVIGVPWIRSSHAFNMKTPDVFLAPEDLQDEELMAWLESLHVMGCYIFTELPDYGFLRRFRELFNLYILRGSSIQDLGFLEGLEELNMIFLQDEQLKELDMLVRLQKAGKGILGGPRCLALDGCRVEDISALLDPDVWFSELVIICPKGSNEEQRWAPVDAIDRAYVEFDPAE